MSCPGTDDRVVPDESGAGRPSSRTKKPATSPSPSRDTENADGATVHQRCRSRTDAGPVVPSAIVRIARPSRAVAGSTANGWASLGKNASRTTGLSRRYRVSAV